MPTPYQSIAELVQDLENHPVEQGGHIYHPIPFPEFSHLKTSSNRDEVLAKGRCVEQALRLVLPGGLSGAKILDVGANAGFYTFSLAQAGATVTAFEPHPRYAPLGGFLAAEKKLDVRWHGTAFEQSAVRGQRFDAALMFSVFQWMADGGNRLEQATADLRAISEISGCLVFELGYNRGKSCVKTNKLNHYAELIRFLETATVYKHFQLLAKTKLWRGASRYLVLCSHRPEFKDSAFRRMQRALKF